MSSTAMTETNPRSEPDLDRVREQLERLEEQDEVERESGPASDDPDTDDEPSRRRSPHDDDD